MSETREPRGSRVNAGRSPAAIVFVGLLGLAGLVWMIWPKPALRQELAASDAGSAWELLQDRAVLRGPTMGTQFSVVLSGEGLQPEALERLQAEIDAELVEVNAQMSTYLPDSELSRFNTEGGVGEAFGVSAELAEVVALALEISAASQGAFDVTVGPLVDAWGFGPDPRQRALLGDETIAALRDRVGYEKLLVEGASLRKTAADLRVDLSAIAKGHGCDRVAALVEAAGHANYMVEIGGEVRVAGSNPRGEAWRVGIERPTRDAEGARAVEAILRVRDVSVATSGDYRNYFEQDGVRYSHTLDPRTGRPITHGLASVTVIDPASAARADAWATALNVLGPEAGLALAEERELAAYFLVRTAEGFEIQSSTAFAPYLPDK